MAPEAFWASWADALPMLQQRFPELTRQVLHVLEGPAFGCLSELQEATERFDRCGFVDRPKWDSDEVSDHDTQPQWSLASGNMVGSTTRLPLSSTIFGRR